jgi:hypothetical protein
MVHRQFYQTVLFKNRNFIERYLLTFYQHLYSRSRVNEGFYFLILRNSSDFDDFFFKCVYVFIYVLFEIRNILFGARKYLYCLNNNLLFMEKNPFSTIFISKIFFIWKLKYKE